MGERKKGIILSYVYIFCTMAVTFLYTPFLLKSLGQSEYGLYSLAYSVIAYLSILDLGFGNSMIRYISKYKANKDYEKERETNGLFLLLYALIGVVTLIIGFILLSNISLLFGNSLTELELKKITIIMFILILNVALSFPLSIFGSYIIASEKFSFQKIILIAKTVLLPIIMIPFLLSGFKSITMVIIITILTLLMNLSYLFFAIFKIKMKFSFKFKNKGLLKEIIGYSFFIFLSLIVDNIFNNTDQVILGATVGTISVSVYALSIQIRSVNEMLSTSISSVFLPKIVSLNEENEDVSQKNKKISDLFIKISRIQFVILLLVLSGFICFGRQFLILWTDKSYIDAYYIVILLITPAIIPLSQNVGLSVLQAKNKHKFRAIVYLIIAILNIFLSIPLAYKFGGIGTAIGTCISIVIGHIIIMNFYYWKKIKLDIPKYWKMILRYLFPISIYTCLTLFLTRFININNWVKLICAGIIYSFIYLLIIYMILPKEDKFKLNNIIKNICFKTINIISSLIPLKNYILIESGPDFSDGAYNLYLQMLKNNLNEKYKLVWIVSDKNKFNNIHIKNVKFINYNKGSILQKIRKLYYNITARMIIDSNKYVKKINKRQIRIHLTHGMPIKKVTSYFRESGKIDYIISPSKFFDKILCNEFNQSFDIKHFGMARNDSLFIKDKDEIRKKLNLNNEKIIVWLPTYRERENKNCEFNVDCNLKLGIPVFYDEKSLNELNEYLKEKNLIILLKVHPAQDISKIKKLDLSNFKVIDDNYLLSKNILLYELLGISSSLITDYSSVFYDYLLLNNPIGLTIDDIEIYEKNVGFVDNYYEITDGEYIKNIDDFYKYLEVVLNKEKYVNKYNEICKKYNKYLDDKAAIRLYEFICDLLRINR